MHQITVHTMGRMREKDGQRGDRNGEKSWTSLVIMEMKRRKQMYRYS